METTKRSRSSRAASTAASASISEAYDRTTRKRGAASSVTATSSKPVKRKRGRAEEEEKQSLESLQEDEAKDVASTSSSSTQARTAAECKATKKVKGGAKGTTELKKGGASKKATGSRVTQEPAAQGNGTAVESQEDGEALPDGLSEELSTMVANNDLGALDSWIAQQEASLSTERISSKASTKGIEASLKRAKRERDSLSKESKRLRQLLHYEHKIIAEAQLEHGEPYYIAGTDEVGVGPLAGPIVACAVVLPDPDSMPDCGLRWWKGLDDSKRVHKSKRAEMAQQIKKHALAWSVGIVEAREVDELNNYQGSIEAMRRAIEGLSIRPDHLLVDARDIQDIRLPKRGARTGKATRPFGQTALISGDRLSQSIAAASIIAKVLRDEMMDEIHLAYPQYNFIENKGYGTAHHMRALKEEGPCPHHRFSFRPVAEAQAKLEGKEYIPPQKKKTKSIKADEAVQKDAEGKPILTALTNWLSQPWKKGSTEVKSDAQTEAVPVAAA